MGIPVGQQIVSDEPGNEASGAEMNNGIGRLSGLPNEVLLHILSFLTIKEVKRTSLVSEKWRRWLLGYYPKMNFEDWRRLDEKEWHKKNRDEEICYERLFISRVVDALKQHLDSSIDEFRVNFGFDKTWQSHIDNWIAFALAKRVRILHLNFRPTYFGHEKFHQYGLTPECIKPLDVKHALTSLSLNFVHITSEVVESILLSCPCLENLIIQESESLASIRSSVPSLSLKYLDVSRCYELEAIDISAPKLLCFRYDGKPIELNIENATSLSSVCIGPLGRDGNTYALESLSKYLPQLETLSLKIHTLSEWEGAAGYNAGGELPDLPLFTKLKVLELTAVSGFEPSLLGWTPLIEACPVLEKLTLKFKYYDHGINFPITTRNGSPLKSLKKLEIVGYRGRGADIELATFIFENATMLKEVVVETNTHYHDEATSKSADPVRLTMLKEKVPEGVSFVCTESNNYNGKFKVSVV